MVGGLVLVLWARDQASLGQCSAQDAWWHVSSASLCHRLPFQDGREVPRDAWGVCGCVVRAGTMSWVRGAVGRLCVCAQPLP